MALSSFESSPLEVLEKIALSITSSFLGPPSGIISLLLVSKPIWKNLALEFNPHLYARIFSLKFDTRAPVSRLSGKTRHLELSTELVKRCQALKRLKSYNYGQELSACLLRSDLWVAYSMFLESDIKNSRQLIEFANVDQFASRYVSLGGHLHSGANENGGWTVDSEENALALWVFWFTDKQRVASETPTERQEILQALAPLFVGSFKVLLELSLLAPYHLTLSLAMSSKYASAHAPITAFHIPPATLPPSITLPWVISHAATTVSSYRSHFGLDIALARPLILPPALLSYVVRLEVSIFKMNWQFTTHIPATRADALAIGWQGPTREDHMKQKLPTTRFVEWNEETHEDMSERHGADWTRLLSCCGAWDDNSTKGNVFTLGNFHGKWVGRWFGIPPDQFEDLISSHRTNTTVCTHTPLVFPVPMQLCIREHYQSDPNGVVGFDDISSDDTGKGVFNAWLPQRTHWAQIGDELEVYVRGMRRPYKYRTYNPHTAATTQAVLDAELAHSHDEILDVVVTAETDEQFAQAWGYKCYYGRIRLWDGLIVLVREATETEGQWIFRGYLHGNQNLVGLWRETGTPMGVPAWEGVWSMTKVDEE